MTDETKNLKLFKYNTKTDRKEKFSIDDALNDNWDKVDEAINANKESIAEVKEEELALKEDKANKGVPGGYAGLDAKGKVFDSQLDLSGKQDVLVAGEGIKIVGNTISSTVEAGVSNYGDLVGKPTKLSDFVDDLGNAPVHTHEQYLTQHQDLSGKQDVLVPGEGIKIVGNTISSTVEAGASEEELALKEDTSNKGVANGYAGLDSTGKVPISQLPELGVSNYEDLVGKPTKLSDFVDDLGNAPVHTHSQYLTQHQDISGKANVDMSNVSADVLKNLIGAGSSGGVKETYISEDKNSSYIWFDNGLLIQWIHIPSRQYPFTSKSGDFGAVFYTPTPIDYSLLKDYTNTAYYANLHPYNARGDLDGAQKYILPKGTKQVTLAVLSLDTNNTGIPAVVDIITVGYCDPSTT